MERAERERLMAMYAEGYEVVMAALAGITEREWISPEAPGEWSSREVCHHLGDSEMISAARLRRLIVEVEPRIEGYDEAEFARVLFYDRPVEASLAAFKAARESTLGILQRLSDDQWRRRGHHSTSGPISVEWWLGVYGVHAHEHAEQIRRGRIAAQTAANAPVG